jgi:hypothetical protein
LALAEAGSRDILPGDVISRKLSVLNADCIFIRDAQNLAEAKN